MNCPRKLVFIFQILFFCHFSEILEEMKDLLSASHPKEGAPLYYIIYLCASPGLSANLRYNGQMSLFNSLSRQACMAFRGSLSVISKLQMMSRGKHCSSELKPTPYTPPPTYCAVCSLFHCIKDTGNEGSILLLLPNLDAYSLVEILWSFPLPMGSNVCLFVIIFFFKLQAPRKFLAIEVLEGVCNRERMMGMDEPG